METAIAQILARHAAAIDSDEDTSDEDYRIDAGSGNIEDTLISQEGTWIEGNRPVLMRIWKGL